jgi:hypothetical protein
MTTKTTIPLEIAERLRSADERLDLAIRDLTEVDTWLRKNLPDYGEETSKALVRTACHLASESRRIVRGKMEPQIYEAPASLEASF